MIVMMTGKMKQEVLSHSFLLQSWLTREERQMAARINMTYARPEQFKPSCGTSDPSIMQARQS